MFFSRWSAAHNFVDPYIKFSRSTRVTRGILFGLLVFFLFTRLPLVGGTNVIFCVVFWVVSMLYVSAVRSRFEGRLCDFYHQFVPTGTAWWGAPFMFIIEVISYLIRPVFMVIRPVINLSIGAIMLFLVSWLVQYSEWFIILGSGLVIYEYLIAWVHWYILAELLSYSENG